MDKDIKIILKRMEDRYNILLELCKQMGINVDKFSKGVQVQYGQKQQYYSGTIQNNT